jgi:hypothetical protein
MSTKPLQNVAAIISRRDARQSYRRMGWREAIMDILRADAMNLEYLSPMPRRRKPACDCN